MIRDKTWLTNEIEIIGSEMSENYPHEQMVDREYVLNLIDQLDEPDKVIIPQFVADRIRFSKEDDSPRISMGEAHISKELNVWLAKTEDYMTYPNQEKFMRAWLDGYEVEKEKLYWVIDKSKRPILTIHEGKVIASASVSKVERAEKLSTPDYKYRLTEKQIKDYDERFWQFAVEVAE